MGNLRKNYICVHENGAHRLIRLVAWLLLLPLVAGIASCSGDDKDEDEPKIDPTTELYGTWEASETFDPSKRDGEFGGFRATLEVDKNGITAYWAYLDCPRPGGAFDLPEGPIVYRCEVLNHTIKLYKSDNTSKNADSILSCGINGDKLFLMYLSGEKPTFLSEFSEKIVTFTRK